MTPREIRVKGGQWANLKRANLKGADLTRADLRWANLTGADLTRADLRWAKLREANLKGADLRWANLTGADLREANLAGADLREANLAGADLTRADLRWANLTGANLAGANLAGANLTGADLTRADLRGANLKGADLTGTRLPYFQIPQTVSLHGFKKIAGNKVIEVLIPAEAKRTASLVGRKCRAEYVTVVTPKVRSVPSLRGTVTYTTGQKVIPDKYDDDIRVECTNGIHFFLTREEAEEW